MTAPTADWPRLFTIINMLRWLEDNWHWQSFWKLNYSPQPRVHFCVTSFFFSFGQNVYDACSIPREFQSISQESRRQNLIESAGKHWSSCGFAFGHFYFELLDIVLRPDDIKPEDIVQDDFRDLCHARHIDAGQTIDCNRQRKKNTLDHPDSKSIPPIDSKEFNQVSLPRDNEDDLHINLKCVNNLTIGNSWKKSDSNFAPIHPSQEKLTLFAVAELYLNDLDWFFSPVSLLHGALDGTGDDKQNVVVGGA